jgi:tetratricopeptide (TPR) repeat protein
MENTSSLIFTLLIVLVPIMLSRLIMENALKKLDGEIKLKLLDAFSNQRKYTLFITLPSLIVYILTLNYFPAHTWTIIIGFGSIYMIYFVLKNFSNYKKVKKLGVPISYLKKFKMAIILIFLGFICLGIYLLVQFNSSKKVTDKDYEAAVIAYKAYEKSLKNDYWGAIKTYSDAIDLDSTVATYYLNRGTSYLYLGDTVNAAKDYKKAEQLGAVDANNYLLYVK